LGLGSRRWLARSFMPFFTAFSVKAFDVLLVALIFTVLG
jgi:hypothetical protein